MKRRKTRRHLNFSLRPKHRNSYRKEIKELLTRNREEIGAKAMNIQTRNPNLE
jgi:hypothetical protein